MTTNAPTLNMQFSYAQVISPDIANPSLMNFTWEDSFIEEGSPYSVVAYRIGRFNENTGEYNAIIPILPKAVSPLKAQAQ